ncbi:hypothetical protein [Methylobacterium sp. J-077]|uniref:hypothetical protein n=1 Tax=Methylobacterium sp. J-077 TaxID=2836656 RepID=UPI001FB9C5BD|nr:hypothetical protein [Methylobacterium sp. J-077]MCJ2124046.1 hypothetical protein [Methylobacterium sp. J-077]
MSLKPLHHGGLRSRIEIREARQHAERKTTGHGLAPTGSRSGGGRGGAWSRAPARAEGSAEAFELIAGLRPEAVEGRDQSHHLGEVAVGFEVRGRGVADGRERVQRPRQCEAVGFRLGLERREDLLRGVLRGFGLCDLSHFRPPRTWQPPGRLTLTLLAREGQWRVPPVAGIITTPTLRPDGSLLTAAGYDPATRLYLAHDPGFTMPDLMERPDRNEAIAALAFIEALLVGFPFVGPVDRAVALSGILTALVRGVLPTAPLHAIRAHSPGTGKSFLVDLAAVIATGRRCPVIAAGKTEEETEKRLGALLRDAVPVVSIDNINGELGGDMLCQLTERPLVRVRILGKSEAPELECRSTTFATGNNLVLAGDMTRRAVLCSLDAEMDRPELRDFSFNPLDRVMANRGAYVAAALTVIRAYQVAGSPTVCGPLGSYEDWSAMVRSPLVWLGHDDPVVSMETAREEDPELSAIRELFEHWRAHLILSDGYTTNSITKTACAKTATSSLDFNQQGFLFPEFRDLLLRQAGEGGVVNSRRFGKWLSRIKGRVVDGHRIEMREDGSHGNRFSLCRVSAAPAYASPGRPGAAASEF